MDETLVHCNENPSMPCDVILDINVTKNQIVKAGINIRPYAKELLKNLSKSFEIIIFTASHSCYAEKVFEILWLGLQFFGSRVEYYKSSFVSW